MSAPEKYDDAIRRGYTLISYVSSKATTFPGFTCGDNCFILEDNTIQPFVTIGNNVVMWSGNHIGHHTVDQGPCDDHLARRHLGLLHHRAVLFLRRERDRARRDRGRPRDTGRHGGGDCEGHEGIRGLPGALAPSPPAFAATGSAVCRTNRRAEGACDHAVGESRASSSSPPISTSGWRTTPACPSPTRSATTILRIYFGPRDRQGRTRTDLHRRRRRRSVADPPRPRPTRARPGQAGRVRRQRRHALVHRQRRWQKVPLLHRVEPGRHRARIGMPWASLSASTAA